MTRWNASASTFTFLNLLFILSQPTFAAAFRLRARHDGKSHKNHIHRDIEARQNIPNAPFAGIGILSNPATVSSSATLAATTASPPPQEQFDTISAMDTAGFGGAAAPSMASMTAASASSSQATIDLLPSPIFPITVIQVPIYTICPDAPGYMNLTSTISPNATAQYSNATAAAGNATQNTSIPTNNVNTTLLSSSPSTTPAPDPTPPPSPNARIVLNPNGCQTLYSASTTQICSTVITRGGQLPITVSDCSQWVTFSSSILAATAAVIPTATATETAAAVCNCPNIPIPVASQLLGGAGSGSGDGSANGITPTAPNINLATPVIPSRPEVYTGTNPIAFFAAPWHVIAAGAIPSVVQVVSGNNTSSERWSVSTSTSIVTGLRTVGFEGVSFSISLCGWFCSDFGCGCGFGFWFFLSECECLEVPLLTNISLLARNRHHPSLANRHQYTLPATTITITTTISNNHNINILHNHPNNNIHLVDTHNNPCCSDHIPTIIINRKYHNSPDDDSTNKDVGA